MLFEKCCRESDIGYHDDPSNFLRFDSNSRDKLREYGEQVQELPEEWQTCVRALKSMYSKGDSAVQHVFEMAHDLDCIRCYGVLEMQKGSLEKLISDLGEPQCRLLAIEAERLIRATGDRVLSYSPSGRGAQDYVPDVFPLCNRNVGACLAACEPPLHSACGRLLPIDELSPEKLSYVDWMNGLTPLRNCLDGLASNPCIPPLVPKYADIVNGARQQLAADRKLQEIFNLEENEHAALIAYTHDLGMAQREGSLEYELNQMLRTNLRRKDDVERLVSTWGEYVQYLMRAARKLDDVRDTVYRIIRNGDMVRTDYVKGRQIQWGAFVSTTTDLEQAKSLVTGSGSIIACVNVTTGKSLASFGASNDKNEIVLLPTMHFIVTHAAHDKDGFTFVNLDEVPITGEEDGDRMGVDWQWFVELKTRISEAELKPNLKEALLQLGTRVDVAELNRRIDAKQKDWEQDNFLAKHGLDHSFMDRALAIYVYTLPNPPVFRVMNRLLNDKEARGGSSGNQGIGACLPYMKFLLDALDHLPPKFHYRGRLVRGVKWVYPSPANHDPEGHFRTGKQLAWYSFTSTAKRRQVMSKESFCGHAPGPRTIFTIDAQLGYDVQSFSAIPDEVEVLMPPLTLLEVEHCTPNIVDPLHPKKDSDGNLLEQADMAKSGFPDAVSVKQRIDR